MIGVISTKMIGEQCRTIVYYQCHPHYLKILFTFLSVALISFSPFVKVPVLPSNMWFVGLLCLHITIIFSKSSFLPHHVSRECKLYFSDSEYKYSFSCPDKDISHCISLQRWIRVIKKDFSLMLCLWQRPNLNQHYFTENSRPPLNLLTDQAIPAGNGKGCGYRKTRLNVFSHDSCNHLISRNVVRRNFCRLSLYPSN